LLELKAASIARTLRRSLAVSITEVLGRKISYKPLTIPQYQESL
jgi:hypothetical protein